jgi:hypothetical protein
VRLRIPCGAFASAAGHAMTGSYIKVDRAACAVRRARPGGPPTHLVRAR